MTADGACVREEPHERIPGEPAAARPAAGQPGAGEPATREAGALPPTGTPGRTPDRTPDRPGTDAPAPSTSDDRTDTGASASSVRDARPGIGASAPSVRDARPGASAPSVRDARAGIGASAPSSRDDRTRTHGPAPSVSDGRTDTGASASSGRNTRPGTGASAPSVRDARPGASAPSVRDARAGTGASVTSARDGRTRTHAPAPSVSDGRTDTGASASSGRNTRPGTGASAPSARDSRTGTRAAAPSVPDDRNGTRASAPPPPDARPAPRTSRWTVPVLAFACGASVANLYYAQPLLGPIGRAFGVGPGSGTLVVTLTQIGYALGLAFLTPLGDLLENRRLVTRTLLVTAATLALAALAPDFGVFLAASALIGITSVVAQILVPLAAHLAAPEARGRMVGQVTSGLLLGIMLARSVAGFVAAAWGWRAIYAVSALVMLLVAAVLRMLLPRHVPGHSARYGSLLASVWRIGRAEPVLRRRALSQALMFGAFTAYWTAIAYQLTGRHHFGQTGIAVFALVGAAGAAAAPVAGRLGDRGHGPALRAVALGLGLASAALAGFGSAHVVLLALSGILLDFAVQGHQVLSLRDIYGLRPDARARVNSLYMTSVFLGGAVSSAVTGAVSAAYGWSGVMAFAAAMVAAAALVRLWERLRG
ncbi:MFS transporter [Actinacidiphila acididurans]|uniref:MFS transporter n=1 Tax=Actinacidiphila acididurans TaxID=2784346 RepID=A0ABS2TXN7_9ACTN|nr:MFS transporter [Actinacidiphila acididurans]MBM9508101.1 MFS transporter [Actinacidiphila acididurans]